MADIKGRVVRIVSDLPYGGVERRLLTILPRLKDLGWEVSVMCIREAGQMAELFEQAGIRVDVIPFRSRWSPLSLKQLARWLKDNRIDIVHTHMYRCNTSGTVAARLARVKGVISNVHNVNEWDNLHQLFVDRMLARYKDRIIAVSEGVRQNYLEKTRIPTEKVITIHNGVDLKPFQDVPCNRELAAELGIEDGDRVISVFARLVEQKRHIDFLEMAAIVLKTIPNARFMIFGKGKLRDELENTAAELGIAGRVVFAGHRSDIPDLLALTDVVVMCSDKEGFSNALLESMAAGVPTVATDVGGNAEAIVDGDSGFIVPTRQPEVLADRVLRLLKDDALYKNISKAAASRAELFSLDRMLEKTDRLYEELLSV